MDRETVELLASRGFIPQSAAETAGAAIDVSEQERDADIDRRRQEIIAGITGQ